MDTYLKQYQEALVTIGIVLFFASAVCLPFLIGWFARKFQKRLDRLDSILDLIEEAEKYHAKEN